MRTFARSVLLWSCTLAAACGHHEAAPPASAPSTVALVYSGWELFVGNDDVVPADDPSRYPGVLKTLAASLDKADFSHLPAGSLGMVVTYADKPQVRLPLGPVSNLKGAALGTQKDYFRTTGSELVRGLVLAVDELEKAQAGKKYLVVVSDGNDTNNEQAKTQLAALKQRVAKLGITVISLIYKTDLSGPGNVVTAFADSTTAGSAEALQADLAHAFSHLDK